jgi:hypothetical protein
VGRLQKTIVLITLISIAAVTLLVNTTTPGTIGPFGILVIFIFAYLASIGVITYIIYGFSFMSKHLVSVFGVRKEVAALSFRRSYYYSTVIAAAPIMLIGLSSVGAVGLYEFVLVVIFVVIGCLYITKTIR